MKALLLESAKRPWSMQNVSDPLLRNGKVIVRLKAAAFNHRDIWISKGLYPGINYPIIPGSDGAGTIVEVGGDLSRNLLNNKVLINPGHYWGIGERFQGKDFKILGMPDNGTFAELVAVPIEYVHTLPTHLSYEQAAALPLAGMTAWRVLNSRSRLSTNDKVLINGVGGGVALFALQFALAKGCEVWVTSSSPAKIKAAIALGASGGVNYMDKGWGKKLIEKAGNFDVIVDGAGGKGFSTLLDVVAMGGRIGVYGGTTGAYEKFSPQKLFWKQITICGSTMGSEVDFFNMLQFVIKNEIVPVVDEVFPFEEAVLAGEKLASGKQFGKVVLSMP